VIGVGAKGQSISKTAPRRMQVWIVSTLRLLGLVLSWSIDSTRIMLVKITQVGRSGDLLQ
jgi:hypothetical protein